MDHASPRFTPSSGLEKALCTMLLCLAVAALLTAGRIGAEQRSCGTHWTGWVTEADPQINPCPAACERGERLQARTFGAAPNVQYDVQYQCWFPVPTQAAFGDAGSVPHDLDSAVFPFIRGRVDDANARDGAWINWSSRLDPLPQNLRGKEAWVPLFEQISGFLRQSPALTSLREYYPWLAYGVDSTVVPLPAANVSMMLWSADWVEPDPGHPDGFRLKPGAWGATPGGFDLYVNLFPLRVHGASDELTPADWYTDEQGPFFRLRQPERTIDGFPVHGGWLLVTAKAKPPLFLPVSQERALQAFMAEAQRQMSQVGSGQEGFSEGLALYNSTEMKALRRQMIDQAGAGEADPVKAAAARAKAERDDVEQERQLREGADATLSMNPAFASVRQAHDQWAHRLEKLSAAERHAPAYTRLDVDAYLQEDLTTEGEPGAIALMQYNPAYVDRNLSPHVPQILVLPIGSVRDAGRSAESLARMPVRERVPIAIVERTPWSQIQPLLR